jgi:Fe2+ transport system protein FeoA
MVLSLAELPGGEPAVVVDLTVSEPMLRQRLLDLGLTPGARVQPELSNAGGAARAYRMRGALVALRREHSRGVLVQTGDAE